MRSNLKWTVIYNSHLQCNWPTLFERLKKLDAKGALKLHTQRQVVTSKLIKRLFAASDELGDILTRGTLKWALEKDKTTQDLIGAILTSPKTTLTSLISWWEDEQGEITRLDTKKRNVEYLVKKAEDEYERNKESK